MKLASMLESMFFITLGISCVLLLMLFYHFKQRVSKLEQSSETMFEILNNMVHELSDIKRRDPVGYTPSLMPMTKGAPAFNQNSSCKIQVEISEDENSLPDLIDVNGNIVNEDISDDDDSSEYETDYNTDDSIDNSDNDEDSIDSESKCSIDCCENDTCGQDSCCEKEDNIVKVISVDINDSLDNVDTNDSIDDSFHETIDEIEESPVEINTNIIEELQVNKLDENKTLEESDNVSHSSVNTTEVYKKMNVPSLKSLVIEKGLTSDPSKMKKNELIALLESNNNN